MATVDSASARLAAQLRQALSVRNHVDISASRNVVFGAVSEPRHLETFHPFCRSNPIIRWNAESRRDVIEYRNGRVFVREFLEWSDLEGFELLIGPTVQDAVNRVQPLTGVSIIARMALDNGEALSIMISLDFTTRDLAVAD